MPESIEEQNVTAIMPYYDCLQKSDGDGMADFFAPQLAYRAYSTSPRAGRYSRAQFLAGLPAFFEKQAAPKRFEFRVITAQTDRLCAFARGTNPLMSGDRYDNFYHSPVGCLTRRSLRSRKFTTRARSPGSERNYDL
jgi:ketosteroid isomerase-like protein